MADVLKIAPSLGTEEYIEFSPSGSISQPKSYKEITHKTLSGKEYKCRFYTKSRWEIPITRLSAENAKKLNEWRLRQDYVPKNENDTTVPINSFNFYYDLRNNPESFTKVRIQNSSNPLSKMEGPVWDKLYSGKLILQEV